MSKEDFIEAMGHVDDRILERYAEAENRLTSKKPKKLWVRWTAAAACFAVIVGLLVLQKPDVPVYDDAIYSAQEIADLFGAKNDSYGTNAYTKVYVPTSEYLDLYPISDVEYLPLYRYRSSVTALNKTQFQADIERILPKLSASLGEAVPEYEIKKYSTSYSNSLNALIKFEKYLFVLSQNTSSYYITISASSQNEDPLERVFLNGEAIQIDQSHSDAEIILSLAEAKRELFDILDISFSDAKAVRRYYGSGEHGAHNISIYFYNESDHPLNAWGRPYWRPRSDYLCISFSNSRDNSDNILTQVIVSYHQNRTDAKSVYREFAQAKLIPLEDAEALLYNGYVFGGHSCPLCMAAQEKVDFEGYDYVGLEYIFGYDDATGEPTTGIPFYAFYKQIGTAQNGNLIFAKTYVPAIEVSGYKEYFQSQTENHSN